MHSIISWPTHPRKQAVTEEPLRHKTAVVTVHKRSANPPPSIDVPSLIRPALGPLECEILQQVCGFGESTARQVLERMPRALAYTTVMTTMTRLYRKGVLECRVSGKTFFYRSRLRGNQVETQLAGDLMRALVRCRSIPAHEIVGAIVETMKREYPELLRELQRAVQNRESIGSGG